MQCETLHTVAKLRKDVCEHTSVDKSSYDLAYMLIVYMYRYYQIVDFAMQFDDFNSSWFVLVLNLVFKNRVFSLQIPTL